MMRAGCRRRRRLLLLVAGGVFVAAHAAEPRRRVADARADAPPEPVARRCCGATGRSAGSRRRRRRGAPLQPAGGAAPVAAGDHPGGSGDSATGAPVRGWSARRPSRWPSRATAHIRGVGAALRALVDGVPFGATPLIDLAVPAGKHTIVLLNSTAGIKEATEGDARDRPAVDPHASSGRRQEATSENGVVGKMPSVHQRAGAAPCRRRYRGGRSAPDAATPAAHPHAVEGAAAAAPVQPRRRRHEGDCAVAVAPPQARRRLAQGARATSRAYRGRLRPRRPEGGGRPVRPARGGRGSAKARPQARRNLQIVRQQGRQGLRSHDGGCPSSGADRRDPGAIKAGWHLQAPDQ